MNCLLNDGEVLDNEKKYWIFSLGTS